jgi:hypothetical protein
MRVKGNAPITARRHPNGERNEFFGFGIEGAWLRGGAV